MNVITRLSAEERADIFTQTSAELGLPPFFVEKDFWVCWTLQSLFGDPELQSHLTFRGGTSLSKAWQCIERFSEDIDIAMNRQWTGLPPANEPSQASLTAKQVDKHLSALRKYSRAIITETLQPKLQQILQETLGNREAWSLVPGDLTNERDPFTLHLHYPQCGFTSVDDYNQPRVKIELSARARQEPMERRSIQPYAAQILPAEHQAGLTAQVNCVTPRLTFWEKTALLHEQHVRPAPEGEPEKGPAMHQARHLYDLHRLWTHHGLHQDATLTELLPTVVQHRQTFFAYKWVDYNKLTLDKLVLMPPESRMAAWREDYQRMRPMFFGEPPSFEEILQTLAQIQERFRA